MIDNYVDIHCHIVPCVDDGSQSYEESLLMLEKAYDEGVRTIVATPHYGMKEYSPDLLDCEVWVYGLNLHIKESGQLPGLKVLLGCEILYHSGVSDEIVSGQALTLNGTKYVLVEFYENSDYSTLLACVREMKMAGYTPIFAHVERYYCLAGDLNRVEHLKSEGAVIQVNAGDLINDPPSSKSRSKDEYYERSAWELVLAGLVDLVASDAHGESYRRPIMRTALEKIQQVAGEDTVNRLILNAHNIFV